MCDKHESKYVERLDCIIRPGETSKSMEHLEQKIDSPIFYVKDKEAYVERLDQVSRVFRQSENSKDCCNGKNIYLYVLLFALIPFNKLQENPEVLHL